MKVLLHQRLVTILICIGLHISTIGWAQEGTTQTFDFNLLAGRWVGKIKADNVSPDIHIQVTFIDDTLRAIVDLPITNIYGLQWGQVRAVNDSTIRMGPFFFSPTINQFDELSGIMRLGRDWRFPAQIHRTQERITLRAGTPPPPKRLVKPVWTFQTGGAIWGSACLDDRSLFVASVDSIIYCLDRQQGNLRWHYRTQGPVVSDLTFEGGKVYALSDDGFLYALDGESGQKVWAFDTNGGGIKREWPWLQGRGDYRGSGVSIDGNKVFIGSADGHVYALNRETGSELWRFKTDGIVRSMPRISNQIVVFGSYDGYIYAVRAGDGSLLWKHATRRPVVSSAEIWEETVFIGSRSATLYALDLKTGAPQWQYFYWISWVESAPIVDQGILYIGSSDYQRALALDPRNGKEIWTFKTWGATFGTPTPSKDRIFVGAASNEQRNSILHYGKFYCLDRKSGHEIWRYDFATHEDKSFSGIASTPVLDDNLVFVGGLGGVVYAFRQDGN